MRPAVSTDKANAGIRVRRLAPGEDGRAWAAAMAGFDPARAQVLKQDGSAAVYRATILGRECVLKSWEIRGLGDRIKSLAHASRASRHWRGAAWLRTRGIRTAHPYALLSERRPGVHREWLVMEALPGKTLLRHMADRDLSVKQEHALARALALQVCRIAAASRMNRDHKPSNLIVVGAEPGAVEVAIIDTVAIVRNRNWNRGFRMFASLFIEPLGTGVAPRRTLQMRALTEAQRACLDLSASRLPERRELRRRWWNAIAQLIRDHGDPTPRINPLAPPPMPAQPSRP